MEPHRGTTLALGCCTALLSLSLLAACSSSFGGGAQPVAPNTIVVPPGTNVVCQDGTAPPCR